MQWERFAEVCPELAALARERFGRDQLVLLGTLRRDGWPRISPCEVDFATGHLFLGMMWRSRKALDLRRDPRLVVHSVTTNKEGTDGDVKLYGRALEITDPTVRAAFRAAIQARINWAPEEPEYHLFALDVERAAYVVFEDGTQRNADLGSEARTAPPRRRALKRLGEAKGHLLRNRTTGSRFRPEVAFSHTTPSLHAPSTLGGDGLSRHEPPNKSGSRECIRALLREVGAC